ncbi:juvenile hormone esterase-like [Euwallacea fornicatus]|uniref:juvenile hormone esterase-like n=1 Tax=Euwallacea fornicatus TaxID=995702 RepID=UPI0033905753
MAKQVTVLLTLCVLSALGKIIPEEEINGYDNSPIVEIADGFVVGTSNVTSQGTKYNAFRGIPYALPPIGNLRFASPVQNVPWKGYWNATNDANACIQGSNEDIKGDEDCLYVNVYSPQNAFKLAVMVWIYGGGFTSGDSSYESFAPDYLLNDNVVFVSFNYRLGILGFMSTEDQTVSGNWGLKDQVLALKWINDNIESFGGDRNRITIFGESAGGASVSYLLQIPQAQGLFNNAIIQSGSSLNLWALTTRARQAAFHVGYTLGIPSLLARTLLTNLRNVDAYVLQKAAMSVYNQVFAVNPLRGLPWAPIIEAEGPDAVFTKNSDEFLKNGEFPSKVPIMIGHTSNEAGHAFRLPDTLLSYLTLFDISSTNLAPYSLSSKSSVRRTVANEIRRKYFNDEPLRNQLSEVVDFINADQFTRGVRRLAENVAPHLSAVYFYVFGYKGDIIGDTPYKGTGHAEELFYLFKQPGEYSSTDLKVRDKLVRLWTNFAKSSNPTPTAEALLDHVIWPQITTNGDLKYVWLNESINLDLNPDEKDYQFYDSLFQKYGSGGYTTY